MSTYYIASCMFTAKFPELSLKVLKYMKTKPDIQIVRCCIPEFRVEFNTNRIPKGETREAWKELPVSKVFGPEDTIISVCHNCTNIVEEWRGARAVSLWEYIDQDPDFSFPDYSEMEVTLQDCWRTRERREEQDAVRSLLKKMNIRYLETEKNHEETEFCGSTLYREQPEKNSKLAPRHYVEQAKDKFKPHTPEEQIAIMKEYCSHYRTETVVCYCHYCLEGLLQGGVDGKHLAELLFEK